MDINSYDKTIEALTLISHAITSDHYIEDILRLIVIVTAEVMHSKVCSLWLVNEKTQTLKIRATQSINSEYLTERSLKVGEGVVGYVAKHNKPYMVPNVLEEPRFKEKELVKKMLANQDVLMRNRNMKGDEAYRWIRKRSVDSRKSMREVAEAILLSEEL